MNREEFSDVLKDAPLVASVQATPRSPLDDPQTLLKLARASLGQGVRVLRLEGVENIRTIRAATGAPVIGLVKRSYPDSPVYITPTRIEVEELLASGCEIIALDATRRSRPNDENLAHLIHMVKTAGRIVMADVDTPHAAEVARALGADLVGTTLGGYTEVSPPVNGPDWELLRALTTQGPTLAEGRYALPAQVQTAMRLGAVGVVIGGAINDPVKQTQRFAQAAVPADEPVGAVDVGGTWLRWSVATTAGLGEVQRIALPATHRERLEWIEERIRESGVTRVGISAGGTIDPATGEIWESLELVPGQEGEFWEISVPSIALNDGLATAWGHAGTSIAAAKRVFTLAIGTGVGGGLIAHGRIQMGQRGEYPRINDIRIRGERAEDLLGGHSLAGNPPHDVRLWYDDFCELLGQIKGLYAPQFVILCGGVTRADWFADACLWQRHPIPIADSPFGADAGLHGAAALALWPPELP
ncbi:MAG: putative N-acetylmannosamine-6-phosphate 2-epimerase [Fimbriimonadaceae bacterium]|nr:putative N-acetylmannosamine-6-phosphate 2-epimerase [Fimbriimonadaceae bacterium]